jgi:para-aminobenzoate synthetase component I
MKASFHPIPYPDFEAHAFRLCQQAGAVWLDSALPQSPYGAYSFVMCRPYAYDAPPLEHIAHDFLKNLIEKLPYQKVVLPEGVPAQMPFKGGMAGFFSYDLAYQAMGLALQKPSLLSVPAYGVGMYDCFLFAHHPSRQAGFLAVPTHPASSPSQRIAEMLALADNQSMCQEACLSPTHAAQHFQENVQKTKYFIADGSIFQANMAQYFVQENANGDGLGYYQALRQNNPAPFACFLRSDDMVIASSSPERFLKIENDKIVTHPIKGTLSNLYSAEILQQSDKNRAENIMIVDLLRNDLAKSALAGSVQVEQLCAIETYENLHHMVSVISAQKRPDLHPLQVFWNAFAGGSITGAPKKRAMEIIQHLEPFQRGAYCGSAGYISYDHQMDMNILIRSLFIGQGKIMSATGCGITYASDPMDEYQESLLKAQKLFTLV